MAKASDNPYPSILLAEGTTPTSPTSGHHRLFVDTADDTLKRVDSAGTVSTVEGGGSSGGFSAYSDYTPALTATTTNPTLGTGATATGRYAEDNTTAHVQISIVFGTSGTAAGSGTYRVSLPVAAAASARDCFGGGYVYDSSTGTAHPVAAGRVTSTTVQLIVNGGIADAGGTPWAWAASDQIQLDLTYETA